MKSNQRRIKAESAARINAMREELYELSKMESAMTETLQNMKHRIKKVRTYIMIEQEAAK